MFQFLTNASVQLVNRFLPSPFVFSIVLTFIALVAGMILTGQSVLVMSGHWGNGLWSLHGFAMQMSFILVTGYAFANAPIIQRFLDNLAAKVTSSTMAIVISTLVGLAGSWLNWGFGLVVGAIFAKSLARKVANVDYPLLVAAAYSGFVIWHGGFSGSIPLTLSSGGENLQKLSGGVLTEAVPLSQTIFSSYNLIILAVLVIALPLINRLMHPKNPTTVDPALIKIDPIVMPDKTTPAQKLDDSRIIALALFVFAVMYYINYFGNNGFSLGLDIVIGLFLFIGLMAHGTLQRYYRAVEKGIGGIAGIVLLFPFYGGIMGIMTGANPDGVSKPHNGMLKR